jgi:hypothetical protein
MHKPSIPPATAMLVRVVEETSRFTRQGQPSRKESIRLLLADGSQHELAAILIPHGEPSLTLPAAERSLHRDLRAPARQHKHWRQVHPPRLVGEGVAE